MRICVYAVSKNEEQFVERFIMAAAEADLILIADTGSTDTTREKARNVRMEGRYIENVACFTIHISPWRFDLARNAALAMVPSDMDVCVSLDLDEELQPGWRQEIERVWKVGETTRLRYMFDWGIGIKFKYQKIHARNGYRWHHPCHEYPVPDGRIQEIWADTDMLLGVHKPDSSKSRGQYLDLLRLSIEEDPYCPRNAFYYARELSFAEAWEQSIYECERYLVLPRATWPNERCYAYRIMGRCYSEVGNLALSEQSFLKAAAEAPGTREPWVELSVLMYRQQRWSESYAFALRALAIPDEARELVYTVDPEVWGAKPYDYAAIAAWNLGLKSEARHYGRVALEKDPTDPRLKQNVAYYEE